MNKDRTKHGFTLAEAMVILLVLSVVTAALMPMISKKHRLLPLNLRHGQYVCYLEDDGVTYHEVLYQNKVTVYDRSAAGNKCTFVPPQKAAYFLIQVMGGGGGGGGAGILPTSRVPGLSSSTFSSNFNKNAYPQLPTWLTQADYNANVGTFQIHHSGHSTSLFNTGERGGNLTYTYTDGSNIIEKTIAGGAGSTTTTGGWKPHALSYAKITVVTTAATRGGPAGTNAVYPNTPTAGTGGKGAVAKIYENGVLTETMTWADSPGGSAASLTITPAVPEDPGPPLVAAKPAVRTEVPGVAGVSTLFSATTTGSFSYTNSGTNDIAYYRHFETKTWKYGGGGGNGHYRAVFVNDIKRNVPIVVGAGGPAAANSNTTSGSPGFPSSFGEIAAAGGGDGGTSNLSETREVGSLPYAKAGGTSAASEASTVFQISSGISGALESAGFSGRGQGGSGGGTISACNTQNSSYAFGSATHTITTQNCSDGATVVNYHGAATAGVSGAVVITW